MVPKSDVLEKGVCCRLQMDAGSTLFLPGGWIHAVLTTEDSVCVSGNFLTFKEMEMQLRLFEMEVRLESPKHYMFPKFQILCFLAANYLECTDQQKEVDGFDHLLQVLEIWKDQNKEFKHFKIPPAVRKEKLGEVSENTEATANDEGSNPDLDRALREIAAAITEKLALPEEETEEIEIGEGGNSEERSSQQDNQEKKFSGGGVSAELTDEADLMQELPMEEPVEQPGPAPSEDGTESSNLFSGDGVSAELTDEADLMQELPMEEPVEQPGPAPSEDGTESSNLKKCPQCNKILSSKSALSRHMNIHKNNSLHQCTRCQKTFGRKDHLDRHTLFHGEKNFKCNLCPSTLHTKTDLIRHKRKVHNLNI